MPIDARTMVEQTGLKNRGHSMEDMADRRQAAEAFTGAKLEEIAVGGMSPETASKNIENMIGTVQIPLGYAGPVHMEGG